MQMHYVPIGNISSGRVICTTSWPVQRDRTSGRWCAGGRSCRALAGRRSGGQQSAWPVRHRPSSN